jgi:hypothetical protein
VASAAATGFDVARGDDGALHIAWTERSAGGGRVFLATRRAGATASRLSIPVAFGSR